MQKNLSLFDDIDVNLYAVSSDTAENLKQLQEAGDFTFAILSDPDFQLIEGTNMKNEEHDVAFRGFALIDVDGEVVFTHKNDHWGEQIDETSKMIHKQYKKLQQ